MVNFNCDVGKSDPGAERLLCRPADSPYAAIVTQRAPVQHGRAPADGVRVRACQEADILGKQPLRPRMPRRAGESLKESPGPAGTPG